MSSQKSFSRLIQYLRKKERGVIHFVCLYGMLLQLSFRWKKSEKCNFIQESSVISLCNVRLARTSVVSLARKSRAPPVMHCAFLVRHARSSCTIEYRSYHLEIRAM
jgi:hypothetical protein